MMSDRKLTIAARGDTEIAIARVFDAPRTLVFEAYTKPAYLKRWLGVWGGWELAVCEMDLRVGGAYRWVWRNTVEGKEMGVGGVIRELDPPAKLVTTERFDDPWYPGDGLVTVEFVEDGPRTTLKLTLRYETKEARDMVLRSPMEGGLAGSYDALEAVLRA